MQVIIRAATYTLQLLILFVESLSNGKRSLFHKESYPQDIG